MTYFLVLSFLLCGYFKYLLIIVLILFIHDIGHVIFIKFLGYKIDCIEILPFGANIKTDISLNSDSKHVLLISIAGIFMQIILFVLVYIFYYNNLISDLNYKVFFNYNLLLMLFNMLPIYPLDGYKFIISLLELFFSFRFCLILGYVISIFFLLIFLFCNYYFDLNNYCVIFFLFFKLIEYIKNYRYIMNKFYVERYLSDRCYKKVNYIYSLKNIRKNFLNFINNENERKVLKNKLFRY